MLRTGALFLASLALLAGCGGDDDKDRELSAEQKAFADRITAVDKQMDDALAKLAATGQGADRKARVPDDVRKEAETFVASERKAVATLEQVQAPEDAKGALDRIVASARKQADAVEQALAAKDVTMEKLGSALLANQPPPDAFDELADKGYLPEQPQQ